MDTAEAIARAAYRLAHNLDSLETLKHGRRPPPEARIMKPTFGPSTPGNPAAIDADFDIWLEIRAWCRTLNHTIGSNSIPPAAASTSDFARWVAITAHLIAADPDAPTFLEELMRWQAHTETITGSDAPQPAEEPWQLAETIIQAIERLGGEITRRALSDMAKRGDIDFCKRMTKHGERNTYRLSQVVHYMENRSTAWTFSPRML